MDSSSKPPTSIDGWNDPPANLAHPENISTKRALLNKRVPYTNQDLTSSSTGILFHSSSDASSLWDLLLAANPLTAPPTCLPTTVSESIASASNETSLTIDEISAIFKRQLVKLEESSTIEVKTDVVLLIDQRSRPSSRRKLSKILVKNSKWCMTNGVKTSCRWIPNKP